MIIGHDEGKNEVRLCDGVKVAVCVEMGGTGGNTKKEARENLDANPVLLWENKNPTSEFEAQTVTLFREDEIRDLNEEDYLFELYLVTFRVMTSVNRIVSVIVPAGKKADVQWIENIYSSSNLPEFNGRQFIVNGGYEVVFDNAFETMPFGNVATTTECTNKLIPQAIYGLHANVYTR